MILILSEGTDQSTSDVIDWLNYYDVKYFRINYHDIFEVEMTLKKGINIFLKKDNLSINLSSVNAYWYRRGDFNISSFSVLDKTLSFFRNQEVSTVVDFLHLYLKQIPSIGSWCENNINKIEVLTQANQIGLIIPRTIVTTRRDEVNRFLKECKQIITKPLKNGFVYRSDNYSYDQSTMLVEKQDVSRMPKSFSYMLFQENLEKQFELRVFYLDGDFYSTAVFPSKGNIQAHIDIRNTQNGEQNRIVPFKLPIEVESKIDQLMKKLKLISGSIDLIVDNDFNYYFLEINPIGQFAQVSAPGNYNLEKIIAQKLIKYDKK